jgi:hypothetical protein
MDKLGFQTRLATFYSILKRLKEENFVKECIAKVSTKPIDSKSLSNSRRYNHGRITNGVWANRTRRVILYSLTDSGYKEMFQLEFKIRIALSCSINGESI